MISDGTDVFVRTGYALGSNIFFRGTVIRPQITRTCELPMSHAKPLLELVVTLPTKHRCPRDSRL